MDIRVRPLATGEVDRADAILRRAFGTFLGLPDPAQAFGDAEILRTRWRARHTRVLGAYLGGTLVGSNVISRWGSLGWFGPLTVAPEAWRRGVAKALMEETERVFDDWNVAHRGLFTFPQSAQHLGLYQRFGYWPRFLTPVLERTLPATRRPPARTAGVRLCSTLGVRERANALRAARELTDLLLPGLDLEGEVSAGLEQGIGETVLRYDDTRLDGVAVCHVGSGSEAGSGATYVKFAAVRPGGRGDRRLARLLDAVEALARWHGAPRVEVGVNSSHRDAFRLLRGRGYRPDFVGVAMDSPDEPAYHRPDLYVLDDWR